MDIRKIAQLAHEVNRTYCKTLGDMSQVSWDDAPEWQKQSALDGVMAIEDGRVEKAGDSHVNWLMHKMMEGWAWGPVKDPEAKTHPCMVKFKDLSMDQQVKDHLFFCTVKTFLEEMKRDV